VADEVVAHGRLFVVDAYAAVEGLDSFTDTHAGVFEVAIGEGEVSVELGRIDRVFWRREASAWVIVCSPDTGADLFNLVSEDFAGLVEG
jgi:hypothetical protein